MHFEVPKAKSLKQFAGEYVMIVVSILTALALEHAVQRYHRSHLAEQAARNLNAEIRANTGETRAIIAHNSGQIELLSRLGKILLADIRAGTDDRAAVEHMLEEAGNRFGLSIRTPSLQREAWDVAVANQALSHMPPEQLQRYARVYASMRDTQTVMMGSSNAFLDLPQFTDTASNMEMGGVAARDLYRVLRQMSTTYGANVGNLKILERDLTDALAKTGGGAAH